MSDSLERILRRVRSLIERAEHPSTPPEEAKSSRAMADKMMLDYSIEQAELNESRPAVQQVRPGKTDIDNICSAGSPYEQLIVRLTQVVASHCRCQVVFSNINLTEREIQSYTLYTDRKINVKVSVFGFEADREYFNMLFTTLHLHMAGGFDPQIDPSLSDGANARALHNAGLNWRQIARLYYPRHPHGYSGNTQDLNPETNGSYWRQQYNSEIRRLGEQPVKLPKFSDAGIALISYRYNFAQSYISTIDRRLADIRQERSTTGELVLASQMDRIQEVIHEMFPNLSSAKWAPKDYGFNERAWLTGRDHGNKADLNATSKMSPSTQKEL